MLMLFDIKQEPCRLMLGMIYHRMYTFFKKYDSHADHDGIVQHFLMRLIMNDPTKPVSLVLVLEDNRLVGHLFLTIEQEFGVNVCYVHQAEVDSGHFEGNDMNASMDYAEAFAKSYGAKRLMLVTSGRARAYERRYHFKVHRIVMTKDLTDEQQPPGPPVHQMSPNGAVEA
jgi:hypothetical protein